MTTHVVYYLLFETDFRMVEFKLRPEQMSCKYIVDLFHIQEIFIAEAK